MDITSQSQQSIDSLNSSDLLSQQSSFQSTQSLASIQSSKIDSKDFECQNKPNNNFDSPKQQARFNQQKRLSDQFCNFQQPFVGFVGFGKNKHININQSKLKKAKKFMDFDNQEQPYNSNKSLNKKQQQTESNSDSQSTHSIGDSKTFQKPTELKQYKQPQYPDFSLGFKSLGTGTIIKISQQTSNKVKMMFSQFDLSQQIPSKSKQKQTKSKLSKVKERQSIKFTNFVKTEKVKYNQKQLKQNLKIQKKSIMNENKKMLDGAVVKLGDNYKNMKLKDMPKVEYETAKQFMQWWKQHKYETQSHSKSECSVTWCYFCQKYKDKTIQISKQFIQQQVQSCLKMQQQTRKRIPKLIQLIIFKLSRIQYVDGRIKNKRVNANNIILQLYKKCLFYEKQRQGPLQCSLASMSGSRGKNFGKQINLLIVGIAYNEGMELYFVQLSDGWSSVFAVLSSDNELVQYVGSKLVVGTKIQIVNWNIHPLCNILQHHPNLSTRTSSSACIQITYNNSLPSPYFSKLGWTTQIFYKPIHKCRQAGGLVPLLQGIIIRMFSIKNNKNYTSNYLQVLLREGECMLMKVMLAEQVSLVQLFRLYYCYHFVRVKKVSKCMLEFVGSSKYYEVDDKDRMDKVKQLLKNRLINRKQSYAKHEQNDDTSSNTNNQESNINQNTVTSLNLTNNNKQYIDIVTKSDSFTIGDTKVHIQQKIQSSTPVLLQQYVLASTADGLVVSKGDRGSCLRRIPKIYQNIAYTLL